MGSIRTHISRPYLNTYLTLDYFLSCLASKQDSLYTLCPEKCQTSLNVNPVLALCLVFFSRSMTSIYHNVKSVSVPRLLVPLFIFASSGTWSVPSGLSNFKGCVAFCYQYKWSWMELEFITAADTKFYTSVNMKFGFCSWHFLDVHIL